MRDLLDYLDYVDLHSLARCQNELMSVTDQIGFMEGQIAERKRDIWSGMPGETIGHKDRAANYAVADQESELARLKATQAILKIEASFIERLLDASRP